jgi:hypothetical protein
MESCPLFFSSQATNVLTTWKEETFRLDAGGVHFSRSMLALQQRTAVGSSFIPASILQNLKNHTARSFVVEN